MNRHLVMGLLVCGFLAGALLARPGVVTLKDGQKIEGDVTKDQPDQVTISIRGIETAVSRDRIESVVYFDSMQDELAKRRAALGPQDATGRIALARWAFDNRMYAEARDLLDEVLEKVDPNNREAAELRTLVRRQIELERSANNPPPPANGNDRGETAPPANNGNATRPPAHAEENFLTPRDILLIKIKEAKDRGENMRLNVPADVRRNILRALPNDVSGRDFENASALRKLELVTQYGREEDLEKVALQGDPLVLAEFRQRVQPVVLQGCAAAGCHNTPEAGNFVLFERANSEASVYTNFYILQNYSKQLEGAGGAGGGVFGGQNNLRMIDRQRPQDSLLAQYMLPAGHTQHPHPQAQGFRPLARDRNDARYQDVVRWIRALNPVDPNYRITYTPPQKATPATQPEPAGAGATPAQGAR